MEAIKANEINEIIRAQIENFNSNLTVDEVGTVIKVGDGIGEWRRRAGVAGRAQAREQRAGLHIG